MKFTHLCLRCGAQLARRDQAFRDAFGETFCPSAICDCHQMHHGPSHIPLDQAQVRRIGNMLAPGEQIVIRRLP